MTIPLDRASQAFTDALDAMSKARQVTPCRYAADRGDNPWLDDRHHERQRAAAMCAPCPLRELCLVAAVAEGAENVRGGVDLYDKTARAATRRRIRKAHT